MTTLKLTWIGALIVGILSGCAATAPPTPSPTATPAATASPTPTPALTASPAASPTPSPSAQGDARKLPPGALAPGSYFGDDEGLRFTFTIAASGWNSYSEGHCCILYKGGDSDGVTVFLGGSITSLYARACASAGTEFTPGPTVEDLANALASLEDFETTQPVDVTLSGYYGKRVSITVPSGAGSDWTACDSGNYSLNSGRYYQVAGQTDDEWILDIDGERHDMAFSTTPNAPADLVAEMEAIRDSLLIEPL